MNEGTIRRVRLKADYTSIGLELVNGGPEKIADKRAGLTKNKEQFIGKKSYGEVLNIWKRDNISS